MKVGDYVRIDNGCICKVLKYTDISDNDFYVNTDSQYNVIYKSWIVKSSPNIIDLIEEGDYVNGKLVTSAEDVYTTDNIYIGKEVFVNHNELIIEEDIKSIVTKEAFGSMEYRIGE